jgi:hypothetical protein
MGKYEIINGLPRNPVGRTGIEGRGLLGKWGPNHAADPIVTRCVKKQNKLIRLYLQFKISKYLDGKKTKLVQYFSAMLRVNQFYSL